MLLYLKDGVVTICSPTRFAPNVSFGLLIYYCMVCVGYRSYLNGRAALHFASDYGQLNVCEYLVTHGANVELVDKHGITPLLAAVWEGHFDVCKFLISKGAKKDGLAPGGVNE